MSIDKNKVLTIAKKVNSELNRALSVDGIQLVIDDAQAIADNLTKHIDEYAVTLALVNAMMADESSVPGKLKYLSSDYGPDAANDFRFSAEEQLDMLLNDAFDIRNHL